MLMTPDPHLVARNRIVALGIACFMQTVTFAILFSALLTFADEVLAIVVLSVVEGAVLVGARGAARRNALYRIASAEAGISSIIVLAMVGIFAYLRPVTGLIVLVDYMLFLGLELYFISMARGRAPEWFLARLSVLTLIAVILPATIPILGPTH